MHCEPVVKCVRQSGRSQAGRRPEAAPRSSTPTTAPPGSPRPCPEPHPPRRRRAPSRVGGAALPRIWAASSPSHPTRAASRPHHCLPATVGAASGAGREPDTCAPPPPVARLGQTQGSGGELRAGCCASVCGPAPAPVTAPARASGASPTAGGGRVVGGWAAYQEEEGRARHGGPRLASGPAGENRGSRLLRVVYCAYFAKCEACAYCADQALYAQAACCSL